MMHTRQIASGIRAISFDQLTRLTPKIGRYALIQMRSHTSKDSRQGHMSDKTALDVSAVLGDSIMVVLESCLAVHD